MASHIPSCKQAHVSPSCAQHHTGVLWWSSCGVQCLGHWNTVGVPQIGGFFFLTKLLLGVPAVSCAVCSVCGHIWSWLTSHFLSASHLTSSLLWRISLPHPSDSFGMWMGEVSIPCPSLTYPKFPAKRKFQVHSRIVLISGQLVLVKGERPWASLIRDGGFHICLNPPEL